MGTRTSMGSWIRKPPRSSSGHSRRSWDHPTRATGRCRRVPRGNAAPMRWSTWPASRSPTRHRAGMSPPTSTRSSTSTTTDRHDGMTRGRPRRTDAAARSSGVATPSTVGPPAARLLERLCCDARSPASSWTATSESPRPRPRSPVPDRAQFRALVLRDQHCQFPGCDRPPEWTDAHHLVHWLHGGTTDLDNLVLLCRYHHVKCHEGGWTLHREPDGTHRRHPTPRTLGTTTPTRLTPRPRRLNRRLSERTRRSCKSRPARVTLVA